MWWPVLCYCDNYWKAQRIAIDNYPQWLKAYRRKKLKKLDKPARKRCKSVPKDDENAESGSMSESNADDLMPEDMDEDWHIDASTPFPADQDDQEEPRSDTSRPRARPLMWRDPL